MLLLESDTILSDQNNAVRYCCLFMQDSSRERSFCTSSELQMILLLTFMSLLLLAFDAMSPVISFYVFVIKSNSNVDYFETHFYRLGIEFTLKTVQRTNSTWMQVTHSQTQTESKERHIEARGGGANSDPSPQQTVTIPWPKCDQHPSGNIFGLNSSPLSPGPYIKQYLDIRSLPSCQRQFN